MRTLVSLSQLTLIYTAASEPAGAANEALARALVARKCQQALSALGESAEAYYPVRDRVFFAMRLGSSYNSLPGIDEAAVLRKAHRRAALNLDIKCEPLARGQEGLEVLRAAARERTRAHNDETESLDNYISASAYSQRVSCLETYSMSLSAKLDLEQHQIYHVIGLLRSTDQSSIDISGDRIQQLRDFVEVADERIRGLLDGPPICTLGFCSEQSSFEASVSFSIMRLRVLSILPEFELLSKVAEDVAGVGSEIAESVVRGREIVEGMLSSTGLKAREVLKRFLRMVKIAETISKFLLTKQEHAVDNTETPVIYFPVLDFIRREVLPGILAVRDAESAATMQPRILEVWESQLGLLAHLGDLTDQSVTLESAIQEFRLTMNGYGSGDIRLREVQGQWVELFRVACEALPALFPDEFTTAEFKELLTVSLIIQTASTESVDQLLSSLTRIRLQRTESGRADRSLVALSHTQLSVSRRLEKIAVALRRVVRDQWEKFRAANQAEWETIPELAEQLSVLPSIQNEIRQCCTTADTVDWLRAAEVRRDWETLQGRKMKVIEQIIGSL